MKAATLLHLLCAMQLEEKNTQKYSLLVWIAIQTNLY